MAQLVGSVLDLQNYPPMNLVLEAVTSLTFGGSVKGRVAIGPDGSVFVNDGTNIATLRSSRVLLADGDMSPSAAIQLSKLATNPLARANHTGSQTAATISDFAAAAVAANASAISGASTADRARANHTGTQAAATISDFTTAAQAAITEAIVRARLAALTASPSVNGQPISSVGDPTQPQQAATKAYVDATVQGLDAKQSVRAKTVAAGLSAYISADKITLSAADNSSVDDDLRNYLGMPAGTLAVGDRVLIDSITATPAGGSTPGSPTPAYNGIWTITNLGVSGSSKWTMQRATDTDTWKEMVSAYVFVEDGTGAADTGWVSTANSGGTLGTTAIGWTQFSSAGTIQPGTFLSKTGNVLDLDLSLLAPVVTSQTDAGQSSNLFSFQSGPGGGYLLLGDQTLYGRKLASSTLVGRHVAPGLIVPPTGDNSGAAFGLQLRDDGTGGQVLAVGIDTAVLDFGSPALTSKGAAYQPLTVKTGGISSAKLATGAVQLGGTKVSGTLSVENGGTAATTAAGARNSLGAVGKYSNGGTHVAGATITVPATTHGLGIGADKQVVVRSVASGSRIEVEDAVASNGDVTVTFAESQPANTWRVVIFG